MSLKISPRTAGSAHTTSIGILWNGSMKSILIIMHVEPFDSTMVQYIIVGNWCVRVMAEAHHINIIAIKMLSLKQGKK